MKKFLFAVFLIAVGLGGSFGFLYTIEQLQKSTQDVLEVTRDAACSMLQAIPPEQPRVGSGAANGGEGSSGGPVFIGGHTGTLSIGFADAPLRIGQFMTVDQHFYTRGVERVDIDGYGTMHYRGSEVATRADLELLIWIAILYGLISGAVVTTFITYHREKTKRWYEAELARLRVVDGPYR